MRSDDGQFLIDERLRVRMDGDHSAVVVDAKDFQELQIPLAVSAGVTSLTLEYRW